MATSDATTSLIDATSLKTPSDASGLTVDAPKAAWHDSRSSALIWRNQATDQTAAWGIQGTTYQNSSLFQSTPPLGANSPWQLVDAGGFEEDENILLWRNQSSDQTAIWTFNGTTYGGGALISGAPPLGSNSPWRLVGGVTLDETATLVWRNQATDQTAIWSLSDDGVFQSGTLLSGTPTLGANSPWRLVDAVGDGEELELLWRNQATDQTAIWNFEGSTFVSGEIVTSTPSLGSNSPWELTKFVDVDGNDSADLIWQNRTSGQQAIWFLNDSQFASGELIGNAPNPGASWQIVGMISVDTSTIADLEGLVTPPAAAVTELPATNNLIWANDINDQSAAWEINTDDQGAVFVDGTLIQGAPDLGLNSPWKLIDAIAKPNGGTQYLWRNPVSDQTAVWEIESNTFVSSTILGNAPTLGSNSQWELIANVFLGSSDQTTLVWRNQATDQTAVWTFDANYQFVSGELITDAPILGANSQWKLVDAVDSFGKLDLVWRNEAIDSSGFWIVDGNEFSSSGVIQNAPTVGINSAWKLLKAEDVDGDLSPDLIWQNSATGQQAIWYLDDFAFTSGAILADAPNPGANWRIVGAVELD
ncbi:MAG: hypothetical protein MUC48_01065 [Leptolyngbya sp. Prado105]|jgi:hypothetical protein|nr:hypothetical protein [Leptolyngbya sp. Prado105]